MRFYNHLHFLSNLHDFIFQWNTTGSVFILNLHKAVYHTITLLSVCIHELLKTRHKSSPNALFQAIQWIYVRNRLKYKSLFAENLFSWDAWQKQQFLMFKLTLFVKRRLVWFDPTCAFDFRKITWRTSQMGDCYGAGYGHSFSFLCSTTKKELMCLEWHK